MNVPISYTVCKVTIQYIENDESKSKVKVFGLYPVSSFHSRKKVDLLLFQLV